MKRIDVDAIVYIEARSYKCVFIMEDGTLYEVSMPMGEAIEFMDREQMKGQVKGQGTDTANPLT